MLLEIQTVTVVTVHSYFVIFIKQKFPTYFILSGAHISPILPGLVKKQCGMCVNKKDWVEQPSHKHLQNSLGHMNRKNTGILLRGCEQVLNMTAAAVT